jgi:nitrogen regulatory protein P-II 1
MFFVLIASPRARFAQERGMLNLVGSLPHLERMARCARYTTAAPPDGICPLAAQLGFASLADCSAFRILTGSTKFAPRHPQRSARHRGPMKKIEAIIKPFTLEVVKSELLRRGVAGLTIYEVRGIGRQKGHTELYRGSEYIVDFMPKLKIEVIVRDDQIDDVIDTILRKARTGRIGDGKIFVSSLDEVVRIRTEERGESAV